MNNTETRFYVAPAALSLRTAVVGAATSAYDQDRRLADCLSRYALDSQGYHVNWCVVRDLRAAVGELPAAERRAINLCEGYDTASAELATGLAVLCLIDGRFPVKKAMDALTSLREIAADCLSRGE